MMKLLRIAVVITALFLTSGVVAAQEVSETGDVGAFAWGNGVTWTSSMQIQNVDLVDDATVNLCYYSQTDPTNPTCISPTFFAGELPGVIPSQASAAVFPAVPDTVGTTFNGSVVISADTTVAAISNILSTDYKYGASYEGSNAGSEKISFPIVQYRNAGVYFSQFNVQNSGSGQALVTCSFYKEGQTAASTTVNLTIEEGAAKTVDPQTLTWFQTNIPAPQKWVGSVVCESTNAVPIVGVAELLDTSGLAGTGLYAYSAFTGEGAPEIYLPTVMFANNGYWTAANVQNLGPGAANITIEYIPEAGYPAKASQTISGVAEGGVAVFLHGDTTKWVGAAKVSATGGQNLQAIVNELNTVTGEGSSYAGFAAADASDTIFAPLIMEANGGYWTSINVMNLSGSPQTITVQYSPSSGYGAKISESKPVGINGVAVFLNSGSSKWVGSAKISVPAGGQLIAIVNELNTSKAEPAETFLTYNTFGQ